VIIANKFFAILGRLQDSSDMINHMKPRGPFNLLHQNQYFNGWPVLAADDRTVVMAFPVEGWARSAAVSLRQLQDGWLEVTSYGTADVEPARQQALAALSLDQDGSGWADVGKRDEFIGNLQQKYDFMRPTLFHSPYEAAAAFIIGHRITIPQARKVRARMAEDIGDKIDVMGEFFHAFPGPQKLLAVSQYPGLSETKISRLHAVAQAALDGWLDREHLRSLDEAAALAQLETLPGVGPFFSQGILYRGVGIKDGLTPDDMTYHAIKTAYGLGGDTSAQEILEQAKPWQPYRMWAIVLLHVWLRETGNFPTRTFSKR
jgi:DNA-3-methyladenine glycosylase II